MTLSGRARKQKGATAEREVIAVLSELTGQDLKRNLEQTREGGHGDINQQVGGCSVEIKRVEKLALNQWLEQSKTAAGEHLVPVVVFRRSREPWRVLIELSLEEYARAAKEGRFENIRESDANKNNKEKPNEELHMCPLP